MTDEIDDRLREALSRVEPSETFAERVIAAAEAQARVEHEIDLPTRPSRPWWWAAAAAAILALVPTIYMTLPRTTPVETTQIVGPTSEDVPLQAAEEAVPAPNPAPPAVKPASQPALSPRAKAHSTPRQHKRDRDAELYAEALEAKKQLVRALAITGNAMERVEAAVDQAPKRVPTSSVKNKRPESRG